MPALRLHQLSAYIHKQLPRDPLNGWSGPAERVQTVTLADSVIRAATGKTQAFAPFFRPPEIESEFNHAMAWFASHRADPRYVGMAVSSAHKYVIDDDATDQIYKLCRSETTDLVRAAAVARPPYDRMWIEASIRHARPWRVSDSQEFRDARIGVLITRVEEDEARDVPVYLIDFFAGVPGAAATTMSTVSFLADTTVSVDLAYYSRVLMEDAAMVNRLETKDRDALSTEAGDAMFSAFATDVFVQQDRYDEQITSMDLPAVERDALTRIGRAFRPVTCGPFNTAVAEMLNRASEETDDEAWQEFMLDIMYPVSGMWRFVLAALIMLNAPVVTIEKKACRGPSHFASGKIYKGYEHHVVSLKVPKEPRAVLRSAIRLGVIRRAHTVAGHWCYSHRDPVDPACHHRWARVCDDDGHAKGKAVYHCLTCQGRRWWRISHVRGDATKGVIAKDYAVAGH